MPSKYVPTGRRRGRPRTVNLPLDEKFKFHTADTDLPHLHGFKFYKWAKDYFLSTNRMCLICAANQIGKSTIQWRKVVHWATETSLWPELWDTRPRNFLYVYPSFDMINVELHSKVIPEILPRGKMKTDKKYGWELIQDRGKPSGIRFNSGVTIWLKSMNQKVSAFQGTTIHLVAVDEELVPTHYHELQARLNATGGHYSSVFTPTSCFDIWNRAMNPGRNETELFPEAFKQKVSLYDCISFDDGSQGKFTDEKIDSIKSACGSDLEVRRLVFGEFVSEEGLLIPSFDSERHFVEPFNLTPEYVIYSAVDIGGGGSGHPSAITFMAVHAEFNKAYIVKSWRGENVMTTASDVMTKYLEMRGGLKPVMQVYDHASKEFGIIASRIAEPFMRAEKSRELGIQTLNSLFRNDMLFLFDTPENHLLAGELQNLRAAVDKHNAKDDLVDVVRYCSASVPWDWSKVGEIFSIKEKLEPKPVIDPKDSLKTERDRLAQEIKERRAAFDDKPKDAWQDMLDDVAFWNEQSGNR